MVPIPELLRAADALRSLGLLSGFLKLWDMAFLLKGTCLRGYVQYTLRFCRMVGSPATNAFCAMWLHFVPELVIPTITLIGCDEVWALGNQNVVDVESCARLVERCSLALMYF